MHKSAFSEYVPTGPGGSGKLVEISQAGGGSPGLTDRSHRDSMTYGGDILARHMPLSVQLCYESILSELWLSPSPAPQV